MTERRYSRAEMLQAAATGDLEKLRKIYQVGAKLILHIPLGDCNALHHAARGNHPRVVSQLLRWGFDPALRTPTDQQTALDIALYYGLDDVIAILVSLDD